jgi:hypothetical protein
LSSIGHLRFLNCLDMLAIWPCRLIKEDRPMDDYQEELLEYRALEQDLPEPVEDATEL